MKRHAKIAVAVVTYRTCMVARVVGNKSSPPVVAWQRALRRTHGQLVPFHNVSAMRRHHAVIRAKGTAPARHNNCKAMQSPNGLDAGGGKDGARGVPAGTPRVSGIAQTQKPKRSREDLHREENTRQFSLAHADIINVREGVPGCHKPTHVVCAVLGRMEGK